MRIYTINPQRIVDSQNIQIIMTQILNNIANSIGQIYNIIQKNKYDEMIDLVSKILNAYLKIYKFYDYGIKNINIQIYNQNINTVLFINVQLNNFKYLCVSSNWDDFSIGIYTSEPNIVYQELSSSEKNDLINSIVSGQLYYSNIINFVYDGSNANGLLLKPKNINCLCKNYSNIANSNNNSNNNLNNNINTHIYNYAYISTIYWY